MAPKRISAVLRLTVDVVVLTVRDGELLALAVKRGEPPYQGRWALPGGHVALDEALEAAARRELAEETGVRPDADRCATHLVMTTDPRRRRIHP